MSSCVKKDGTGQQLFLDRDNWFSAETQAIIDAALKIKGVGPRRLLAVILHNGLGLSLETVAALLETTKNTITKEVIAGKAEIAALMERIEERRSGQSLFAEEFADGESASAAQFIARFNRVWRELEGSDGEDEE